MTASMQETTWLDNLREKERERFIARGLPTKREERWKYTDVSFLSDHCFSSPTFSHAIPTSIVSPFDMVMVFINGRFSKTLSKLEALPKDTLLCSLKEAVFEKSSLVKEFFSQHFSIEHYPFAALNTSEWEDGFVLCLPPECHITQPIHCLFLQNEEAHTSHVRNLIFADKRSSCVLVQDYQGKASSFTNIVTQVLLSDEAEISIYKIQEEKSAQLSHVFIEQKQRSFFRHFTLSHSGKFSREDIHVALKEHHAACELNGFYETKEDGQHVDHHVLVDHLAENTSSTMFYKGTANKKSSAVFNGKVFVEKNAKKTRSYQTNHNLLLSASADVNSKPELEIYADDVQCSHGATMGQLDEEAFFYLRSRGIDKITAKNLLIQAFADEVLNKIEHPEILTYFLQRAGRHDAI